jgi:hypothetical protein
MKKLILLLIVAVLFITACQKSYPVTPVSNCGCDTLIEGFQADCKMKCEKYGFYDAPDKAKKSLSK